MDQYYSVKEFAKLLKLHENTIRQALKRGKIQSVRLGTGNSVHRIPKSEISRLVMFDLDEIVRKEILKEKQHGPSAQ